MALTVQQCAGLEAGGDELRDYCGVSEGGLLCAPGWAAATVHPGTVVCEKLQTSTPTTTATTTGAAAPTTRFSDCADATTPTSRRLSMTSS